MLFGKPSPDRFAHMMTKAIRRQGITGPIEYDAESFRLVLSVELDRLAYLRNAYEEYCTAPWRERKAILQKYAAFTAHPMPEIPADFEEAKPKLLPCVRDRWHYESVRLQMQIDGAKVLEIPTRPLADHLAFELACDFPETVASVSQNQLDEWGVSFGDALAVAVENLWAMSNEDFERPAPGIYASPWHDNYDPARLLLPDLIRQLDVKGDPVALVPNRDLLIVTGSENADGLKAVAALARQAFEDPRSISGIAVRLEGTVWKTYMPEPSHPA